MANDSRDLVVKIGNIYGYNGGNYAGNVYDANGISPAILTLTGGNRQPMVIVYDNRKDVADTASNK